MKLVYLFLALFALALADNTHVRYLNSLPQFGSSTLASANGNNTIFSSVPGGALVAYTSLEAKVWSFKSSFFQSVSASSDDQNLGANDYSSVYTCQAKSRKLVNKILKDSSHPSNAAKFAMRVVNLASFAFPIDVSYSSGSALLNPLSTGLAYCGASNYTLLDPGSYNFKWLVSNAKRQPNNATIAAYSNKAYTLYILPDRTLFTQDGSSASKRTVFASVQRKQNTREKRVAMRQLVKAKGESAMSPQETEVDLGNEVNQEVSNVKQD